MDLVSTEADLKVNTVKTIFLDPGHGEIPAPYHNSWKDLNINLLQPRKKLEH